MKRKIFDAQGTIEQADFDTAHLGPIGSIARFGNFRNDRSANLAAEPDLDAHLDHQQPQCATGDNPCYFSPPRIGLSLFHHFPNELISRPKRRFCSAMQICVHHGQSDKNIPPNVLTHDQAQVAWISYFPQPDRLRWETPCRQTVSGTNRRSTFRNRKHRRLKSR